MSKVTAPSSHRPPTRGSAPFRVWLADGEIEQYLTDETYREQILTAMRARAHARGRKLVEIYNARGVLLRSAPVTP